MWYIGPVYNYIAVALDVFMLDMDFAHTDTSIRTLNFPAKALFEASGQGYQITFQEGQAAGEIYSTV